MEEHDHLRKEWEEEKKTHIEREIIAKEEEETNLIKRGECESKKETEEEECLKKKEEEGTKVRLKKEGVVKENEEAKQSQREDRKAQKENHEDDVRMMKEKGIACLEEDPNIKYQDSKHKQEEIEANRLLEKLQEAEKEKKEVEQNQREQLETEKTKEEENRVRNIKENEEEIARLEKERKATEDPKRNQEKIETQKLLQEQQEKANLEEERIAKEKVVSLRKKQEEAKTHMVKEVQDRLKKAKEEEEITSLEEEKTARLDEEGIAKREEPKRKQEKETHNVLKENQEKEKQANIKEERLQRKTEEGNKSHLEEEEIAKMEIKQFQKEDYQDQKEREQKVHLGKENEEDEKKTSLGEEQIAIEEEVKRKEREELKTQKANEEEQRMRREKKTEDKKDRLVEQRVEKEKAGVKRKLREESEIQSPKEGEECLFMVKEEKDKSARCQAERIGKEVTKPKQKEELNAHKLIQEQQDKEEIMGKEKEKQEMRAHLENKQIAKEEEQTNRREELEARVRKKEEISLQKEQKKDEKKARLQEERIAEDEVEVKQKEPEIFKDQKSRKEIKMLEKNVKEENKAHQEKEQIVKQNDATRKLQQSNDKIFSQEQQEKEKEGLRKIREEQENKAAKEEMKIVKEDDEGKRNRIEELEARKVKEKEESFQREKEEHENKYRLEQERIAREEEVKNQKKRKLLDDQKSEREEAKMRKAKDREEKKASLEEEKIANEEDTKRRQEEELENENLLNQHKEKEKKAKEEAERKNEEEDGIKKEEEEDNKLRFKKERVAKEEEEARRKQTEEREAHMLRKEQPRREKFSKGGYENEVIEDGIERKDLEEKGNINEDTKLKQELELDAQQLIKDQRLKYAIEKKRENGQEKPFREDIHVKMKDKRRLQDEVIRHENQKEEKCGIEIEKHVRCEEGKHNADQKNYKQIEEKAKKQSREEKILLTKDGYGMKKEEVPISDYRFNKLTQDIDEHRKDMSDETYRYSVMDSSVRTYKSHSEIRESHVSDNSPVPSVRTPEQLRRAKAQSESRTNGRVSLVKRQTRVRDSKRRPVLSTHLTDRTAVEGSRVKLTCSVLSYSDPTITWYKNGVVFENKTKYRTKFTDGLITLEVLNAVPSDSAEYSCVISNTNGEVSTSANLRVYPSFEASPIPPTFTRSIKDTYHLAEDELVLECRIRGQPLPLITWLKDDKVLSTTDRYQAFYLADGVCRLTITRPNAEDSGKYTCKAENSIWTDQITHVVEYTGQERLRDPGLNTVEKTRFQRQTTELRRPHFSNILTDHIVPSGGTIGLQVEIRGSPSHVEWLREGRRVTELFSNARTFTEHGLYTLALADVTASAAGLYTCRAWNTYGKVDMNAEVRIVGSSDVKEGRPATIVGRPEKDILISVGEDINISFRVQGDPKPKVSWFKGTRDITNSYRSCKMTSDDYVMFTLKRSVVSDAGTYCIMAKNIYGCDRAFVTVVVRQRASSEHLISDWTYPDEASVSCTESSYFKNVPARILGEPVVTDGGANWVSLTWDKPDPRASAPVLAYRIDNWMVGKDGGARWTELGVTPINSYDAFNLKQGEEYHFRVTPKNRYGWGEPVQTSAPIAVGLGGNLPEFVEILPGQLKALKGDRATLRCCIRGKPAPHVVWFKNGQELEEEDSRVVTTFDGFECCLVINEVRSEDDARYSCEATNSVGRVSTYARLSVVTDRNIWQADIKLNRELSEESSTSGETFPPQFSMRPRDRRVQMTYPVRLTCQVTGNPPPAVSWYKDGRLLEADDRHSLSQDERFHTLETSQTMLSDGGVYVATARNQHGAVSCRCTLIVDKGIRAYVSPEFSYGLEPLYVVREGEELRISARVEAYPSVGVAWHRDGVRLRPSRRAVTTLDRDGTVELAVVNVSGRDAGVYACTAANEVGRAVTSCRVRVVEEEGAGRPDIPTLVSPDVPYSREPMFVKKPRSCDAYEGDTVIIHCEVVGDPKPEVVWLRDFLKPDYYRDASHFRRVGDGPEYRFEIPHAKLDFTGAYSVIARNCYGEAKAVISLQIYAKGPDQPSDSHDITHGRVEVLPSIQRPLNDLRCCDGDSVTFSCLVVGTPSPGVRWTKDGRSLEIGGDFVTSREGDEASLTLREAYPEDQGTYACVAFNDLGHASTAACLIVDVAEERSNQLSTQLSRPPELLLSAGSTPRSTPARSRANTPVMAELQHESRRPPASCLKKSAPKFYAYPHNRVVEEGGLARFQCAVAGHPPPWTAWDKDGTPLTATSRLTISERDDVRIVEIEQVTPEDAGLYRIVLENDVGRAEATARLDVISLRGGARGGTRVHTSPRRSPAVYRHLIGSAIRAGERLKLQADIRSSTPVKYKWYRNGVELAYDPDIVISVEGCMPALMIKHARQEHIGEYTVTAENAYGVASSFADVLVVRDEDRPLFVSALPTSHSVPEGGELKLKCQVSCTVDCKVAWYYNRVKLAPSMFFRQEKYEDRWYALVIDDAYLEDSGVYLCVVRNKYGYHETQCNVIVREQMPHPSSTIEDEARFSSPPLTVATHIGGTALFSCRTLGLAGDEVELVWYVAGLPVRRTDPMFHLEDDETGNHSLYILRVDRAMVGEVRCMLRRRDAVREPLAECCHALHIVPYEATTCEPNEYKGACTMRPIQDITVARGDVIKIRVHCNGSPMSSIKWMKGGQTIRPDYNTMFPKHCELMHRDGYELLVMRATDEDAGNYNVQLDNHMSRVTVTVVGVPDAPSGKPRVTVNNKQLFIAWSPPPYDGSQPVTSYRVESAAAGGLEPQELNDLGALVWLEVASAEEPFAKLDRVLPDTYYFRVRAINAQGAGAPSEVSNPVCLDEDDDEEELPVTKVTVECEDRYERDYHAMKTLGHGNFGVVQMVKHKDTGKRLAAKVVDAYSSLNRKSALREIRILNLLHHPKLLHLLAAFESPKSVILVTELLTGGELFDRVSADDFTLTEDNCITFIKQICEGVAYMHANSVVHLDLKPENIMCKSRNSTLIKIVDFGLAHILEPDHPVNVSYGTRDFISPEVVNYEPVCFETDMWSVGVICYVLLSGLVPFKGETWCETLVSISKVEYDFNDDAFDLVSDDAKDFIQQLLVKHTSSRMSAAQSLQHAWLQAEVQREATIDKDKLRKFTLRRKWQPLKLKRRIG